MPSFGLSSARAEASRRNGAKSKGPKTPEGKARAAQNALKHGFRAQKYVVLPGEDAAAFAELEAALMEELAPEGALQTALARRVVAATWRLERAERIEAEIFAREMKGLFGDGDLGLALIRDCNGARSFDTLLRYRGGTLAEFWRALRILKALQAERAAQIGDAAPGPVGERGPNPFLALAPARAQRASVAPVPASTVRKPAPAVTEQPDEPERRNSPCDPDRARNPAERNAEPGPDPARLPLPLPAPGPVGERGPNPFLARAPGARATPIEPGSRRNLGESAPQPAGEIAKNGSALLLAGTALAPVRPWRP